MHLSVQTQKIDKPREVVINSLGTNSLIICNFIEILFFVPHSKAMSIHPNQCFSHQLIILVRVGEEK